VSADSAASEDGHMAELIALIWSDHVNTAKIWDVFVVVFAFSRGQSEQQPGQF
jgi:hypothetical protein